jgi:GNAT superfamily N-acetyltransferase
MLVQSANRISPELGMAIQPEYRGQGIGSKLLRTMLEELKNNGVGAVSLSVDHRNPAIRLYSRFGFLPVRRDGTSITMKAELQKKGIMDG